MSDSVWIDTEAERLDLAAAAAIGAVLLGGIVLALRGMFAQFVVSAGYAEANMGISIAVGVLFSLGGLYLALVFPGEKRLRVVLGLLLLFGGIGFLASHMGLPSVLGGASGPRTEVVFTVTDTRLTNGRRSLGCRGVVATSPGYEATRLCGVGIGEHVRIGSRIALIGTASPYGFSFSRWRVLR